MGEHRVPLLGAGDKLDLSTMPPNAVRSFKQDYRRFEVTSDPATVVVNAAADPAYNQIKSRGATVDPPGDWPFDNGQTIMFQQSSAEGTYYPGAYDYANRRLMHDGDSIGVYWYGTNDHAFRLFVDGKLNHATDVYTFPLTGFMISTFNFASIKTRLLELQTDALIHSIFTKKPYAVWKPAPVLDPFVFIIGDSYCAPAIMAAAGNAYLSPTQSFNGMWQDIHRCLDLSEVLVDGKGGTGYLQAFGGFGNYYDRIDDIDPAVWNPSVIGVHGGGANDKHNGFSNAAIIDKAVDTFVLLRSKWPDAKLIFFEGFTPPEFPYQSDYTAIRQGVQAGLLTEGVDAYFVDTATTETWIQGLGNVNEVNADALNANVYIGGDAAHYTLAGAAYLRDRMAPKMRAILRDTGELVNTLI